MNCFILNGSLFCYVMWVAKKLGVSSHSMLFWKSTDDINRDKASLLFMATIQWTKSIVILVRHLLGISKGLNVGVSSNYNNFNLFMNQLIIHFEDLFHMNGEVILSLHDNECVLNTYQKEYSVEKRQKHSIYRHKSYIIYHFKTLV